MLLVGVIGCGHWGPNHIRIFSQLKDSQVLICSDLDQAKLDNIKRLFPSIEISTNYKDILNNVDIDAVCISSPTNTHFSLTKESLEAGKHVLCEKPLTLSAVEAQELKSLADERNLILMVGHVFIFNSGIVWLKNFLDAGEIGEVQYAYSSRTNLGPFRYDVNALWDLAPHDIAIFNYLFESCPNKVSARGHKCLGNSNEDIAFANLEYGNNIVAHLHVSWLDPRKVRQITIVGEKKMVVWDDLDNLGPIKVYDKHVERTEKFYENYGEFQLLSKEGSITIPKIELKEPLRVQDQHFIDCINKKASLDLVDAKKGEDVVKVLCAIDKSISLNGVCTEVE